MRNACLALALMGVTASAMAATFHTITIDGSNDFVADEVFSTTSVGYEAYLTWDATTIFIGFDGTDIDLTDGTRYLQIYIDVDPKLTPTSGTGTTDGRQYGTQQVSLPFTANYHLSWVADATANGTMILYVWGGAAWTPATASGSVSRSGTFVELSIPITDIGSPTQMYITGFMVNTSAGTEWTFAGVPSDAFMDGYDPNVLHYLGYNLIAGVAPNTTGHDDQLPVELLELTVE